MIAAQKRHRAIWEHALLPSYRKSLRDVTLKACVGVRRTFPLAQTAEALKVLAGRKAMGKVILHP